MQAIVKLGGRQYRVEPQARIKVFNLKGLPGEKCDVREVLMVEDNGQVEVGKPYLPYKVSLEILAQKRGRKGYAIRFFRRGGRRVIRGFCNHYAEVRVNAIEKEG